MSKIQILIILVVLLVSIFSADLSYTLVSSSISAQTLDYTNNRTAIAISKNNIIKIYNCGTSTVYASITTNHATSVSIRTIAFDSTGSTIANGGQDFMVSVYRLSTTSSPLCQFSQLRGIMKQLRFLSGDIKLVGVTSAGYAYVWNISSCSLLASRVFSSEILTSITENTAGNEIWISNYQSTIYRVSHSTLNNTGTSLVVPTRRLMSLISLINTTYLGICTQQQFYLYNNITLIHSRKHLASPMLRCRVSPYWSWGNGYFITVVSGYYQLFTIWKLQLTTPYTWLVRSQPDDNRHGSKIHTAEIYRYNFDQLEVISSSTNSLHIRNKFGDNTTTICDPGTLSSIRVFASYQCMLCVDTIITQACYNCSVDYACQICYANYYKNTSNNCSRCPQDCYSCISATTCTACHQNLVLVGGSCITCSITNCAKCSISSSIVLCSSCLNGYYLTGNKGCVPCNQSIPNCQFCQSSTICIQCDASYKISSNSQACQPCSMLIPGCSDCTVSTSCATCNPISSPYYRLVGTNRFCESNCYYVCLTCNFYYDDCLTCDVNRTRYFVNATAGYSCQCNTNYILDSSTLKCVLCSDFVINCQTCINKTYCQTCSTTYFFEPGLAGYRGCRTCNYSCSTCSGNYYNCISCNGSANRVLASNRCNCINSSYYQIVNISACSPCSTIMPNCLTCFNSSFCFTCSSGYYIRTVSVGSRDCQICSIQCLTCYGASTNCSSCNSTINRVFNSTTFQCQCSVGYFANGPACDLCSSYLTACDKCSNSSVCQQCKTNNYLSLDVNTSKLVCVFCQSTCMTCDIYANKCLSCNAAVHRVLNSSNKQCECMIGYLDTSGSCMNCSMSFSRCLSCNSSHCLSCQNGYALSDSMVYCVDCSSTMIGCLNCSGGGCSNCDSSKGFIVSRMKCICMPGYYFKNYQCLRYQMTNIKRMFPISYLLTSSANQIIIRIRFGTALVNIPYGLNNSLTLTIQNTTITNYTTASTNNTLTITYSSTISISKALITVQFASNKLFDADQYPPNPSHLQFQTNTHIYINSQQLTTINSSFTPIRYIITIFALVGCPHIIVGFSSLLHILPLYLLLNIPAPPLLTSILQSLITLHQQSLFVIPYSQYLYKQFYQYKIPQLLDFYGFNQGLLSVRLIDILVVCIITIFYGFLGKFIAPYLGQKPGKLLSLLKSKFEEKSYEIVSMSMILVMVPICAGSSINYLTDSYGPTFNDSAPVRNYVSISLSVVLCGAYLSGIFVHSSILKSLRNDEDIKIQDAYMGVSKSSKQCSGYIITEMCYWVVMCVFPLYLHPLGVLSMSSGLLVLKLTYYKLWGIFPNKIIFFSGLFLTIGLLIVNSIYFVYYISLNFWKLQISTLQVMGFFSVIGVGIAIAMCIVSSVTNLIVMIRKICQNSTVANDLNEVNTNKSMLKVERIREQEKEYEKQFKKTNLMSTVGFNSVITTTGNIFKRNRKVLIN